MEIQTEIFSVSCPFVCPLSDPSDPSRHLFTRYIVGGPRTLASNPSVPNLFPLEPIFGILINMSALILRDVSVELSTQDDCFLVDIPHLLLELSVDGKAVDSIGLHARKSSSGVWDADEALVLYIFH